MEIFHQQPLLSQAKSLLQGRVLSMETERAETENIFEEQGPSYAEETDCQTDEITNELSESERASRLHTDDSSSDDEVLRSHTVIASS
ncbi:unnamed protein product [Albugo candida]|uniref:Uncharacterized protein n=1 Tax=Albugo candida TaxID=65357 RepID=A0A024FXI8_9STRA|nr:unnamed protein product [Albugo candida]|eukprot:CCI11617.1 unnamed protein product [Albugo candida]